MYEKFKAILNILRGKGVIFKTRFWREGDLICLTSVDRKGGGFLTGCIVHCGEGYEIKQGPVIRFPLIDIKKETPQ